MKELSKEVIEANILTLSTIKEMIDNNNSLILDLQLKNCMLIETYYAESKIRDRFVNMNEMKDE